MARRPGAKKPPKPPIYGRKAMPTIVKITDPGAAKGAAGAAAASAPRATPLAKW
jgi:hypothetical protein